MLTSPRTRLSQRSTNHQQRPDHTHQRHRIEVENRLHIWTDKAIISAKVELVGSGTHGLVYKHCTVLHKACMPRRNMPGGQ
jgi:hypothetical protein